MIPVWHYLVVAALLFGIGLVGFLTRRNLITMFLCAEMMLQGVAINFAAFARYHGNLHGQVFVLFVLAVAACEAGVALALFLMLYRRGRTLDASLWQSLREAGVPPTAWRSSIRRAGTSRRRRLPRSRRGGGSCWPAPAHTC